jgi:hypothetical protein
VRVLLGGEEPVRSAPSLSLGEALRSQGVDVAYSHGVEALSTKSWINMVRACDAVVWIGYDGPCLPTVRQLALAVVLGRPVIRWWVGSDVLYCIRDRAVRARARILASFSAENIAVAPHLAEELSLIGVRAKVIPSLVKPGFRTPVSANGRCNRAVLVYLPASRASFYGERIIGPVIRANPDLPFVIVGDDDHRFRGIENVDSLGWVEDMKPVYDRVGCLLRVTEHDGLPRMVLEALLLGKYVIYSGRFPGTWLARTYEEAQEKIAMFKRRNSLNTEGVNVAKGLFTPPPEIEFSRTVGHTLAGQGLLKRTAALFKAIDLTFGPGGADML